MALRMHRRGLSWARPLRSVATMPTQSIRRLAQHASALAQPAIAAFADGACRGNPGHGACGALLVDRETQTVVASRARYLSDRETNNTAEYQGLLLALELAQELGLDQVQICMDSELVIKQMRGEYRVKAPHLRVLHNDSKARCRPFSLVQFEHVPREQNALADRLANDALDQQAAQSNE